MATADRMFMIALDPLASGYDAVKLQELLSNDGLFRAWWHHIPGCFLVTSRGNADQITDKFMTVSGKARLLVVEVNPQESEGCLPSKSWEWLRRRETDYTAPDVR